MSLLKPGFHPASHAQQFSRTQASKAYATNAGNTGDARDARAKKIVIACVRIWFNSAKKDMNDIEYAFHLATQGWLG